MEQLSRCDACRHWRDDSENQEWEAKRAGFGECVAVRTRWRIMDEASAGLAYGDGDEEWDEQGAPPANGFTAVRIAALVKSRAYVQDGSEYRAELYTAPNFFCALFAANDTSA